MSAVCCVESAGNHGDHQPSRISRPVSPGPKSTISVGTPGTPVVASPLHLPLLSSSSSSLTFLSSLLPLPLFYLFSSSSSPISLHWYLLLPTLLLSPLLSPLILQVHLVFHPHLWGSPQQQLVGPLAVA